jgi:hypothetical protein
MIARSLAQNFTQPLIWSPRDARAAHCVPWLTWCPMVHMAPLIRSHGLNCSPLCHYSTGGFFHILVFAFAFPGKMFE